MNAGIMLALSVVCWAFAVLIARLQGASYLSRILGMAFTFVVLFISSFYLVSDSFTGRGIDEAVVYHLEYGLAGAGFREYAAAIGGSLLLLLLTVSASVFIFFYLRSKSCSGFRASQLLVKALFILAVIINPASKDVYGMYLASATFEVSDTANDSLNKPPHYLTPNVETVVSPLNVVYIYLESVERTYLDEALFPGLMPGLTKLESESVSFTDIRQVYGTGWTVAGMTASQCGVPLVTASQGNSMSGMDSFLSGALCMGDILSAKGYSLDYMGGASLEFAGKGNFYATHGFTNVRGVEALSTGLADPDYRTSWGIYDDTLYQQATARFNELADADRPFGLFMLTLDTHHPNGHPSASCDGLAYGDGDNPILNAAHCADKLVTAFVNGIRQSEYGKNTVVILASDHLAMRNTAFDQLQQGDRKNLFMALMPGGLKAKKVMRPASSVDIAPTVLSFVGFDVPQLGFGRDLMREGPTLVERYQSNAGGFLKAQNPYLSTLWQFPQIDQGLLADARRGKVRFGSREIKMPALFVLDNDARVENVLFDFSSSKTLKDYVVELHTEKPFIWLDDCKKLTVLNVSNARNTNDGAGYCFVVGRSGTKDLHVETFDHIKFLNKDRIESFVLDAPSVAIAQQQVQSEKVDVPLIKEQAIKIGVGEGLLGKIQIHSAGFGQGPSYIQGVSESLDQKKPSMMLARGLSLIGITPDAQLAKLAHIDSCDPLHPVKDAVSLSGSFSDVMTAQGKAFDAYVIVSHDSAKCDPSFDMASLFQDLGLTHWKKIGVRQPYIGLLTQDGEAYESLGSTEQPLDIDVELKGPSNMALLAQ